MSMFGVHKSFEILNLVYPRIYVPTEVKLYVKGFIPRNYKSTFKIGNHRNISLGGNTF